MINGISYQHVLSYNPSFIVNAGWYFWLYVKCWGGILREPAPILRLAGSHLHYIGSLSKSVKLREGWSVFVINGTSQMIHAVVLEFCDSKTIVLKI